MVRGEKECPCGMDFGTEIKWIEWVDLLVECTIKVAHWEVVLSHGFGDNTAIANHFNVCEIPDGSAVRFKEISVLE